MAGIDVLGVGQAGSFVSGDYISAISSSDQIINTPYEIKTVDAFTTLVNSGITVTGTFLDRFTFSKTALYNVQFSLQVTNNDNQAHLFYVWGCLNGNSIPDTGSIVTVHSTHGGNKGHMIVALNLFVQATAGQYFSLCWTADNIDVMLENVPPPIPAIPNSLPCILTISEV